MKHASNPDFGKYRHLPAHTPCALRAAGTARPKTLPRLYAGVIFAAVAGWLFTACGLVETDYQPWYYNYITDRVDLSSAFPRDYQSEAVVVKTLYVNQTAYTILYQNRQPTASPVVVIMDKDLNVLANISDSRLQNPESWYAGPDGTLRLGYLTLTPGTWARALNSSGSANTYTDTRLTMNNRSYDLHLSLSSAGDLLLPFNYIAANSGINQPEQQAVAVYDNTLSPVAVAATDKILVYGFLGANRSKLFPALSGGASLGLYYVAVKSVSLSSDQKDLQMAARLIIQSGSSSYPQNGTQSTDFIIRITFPTAAPNIEALATDMSASVTFRISDEAKYFNVSEMASYGSNTTSVVTGDTLLSFYRNGVPQDGSEQMPYITAAALQSDTTLAFKLPRMEQDDDSPFPAIPQFQPGSDLWFVWDARGCILYRNVPWWKEP